MPIELVKVGDKVLSWNERTGERIYQPVMELIQQEGTYELVKVTLANGEQLEATAGHPFYVPGKGWNAAANLKVGDALLLHNGTTVVVATVDSRVGWERVYNFSVAGNANYFVGMGGVGVHNCRGLWQITKESTEKVVRHSKFGKLYKSKSDNLWWSRDTAGHGGSKWKVFKETEKGLEWKADADEYGDFIKGKHKGDVGMFIPWKELRGANF